MQRISKTAEFPWTRYEEGMIGEPNPCRVYLEIGEASDSPI